MAVICNVTIDEVTPVVILKWKVKPGSSISHGKILLTYEVKQPDEEIKPKSKMFKAAAVGTVKALLYDEGQTVDPGVPVMQYEGCTHPTVMKDMCAECGTDLRQLQQKKLPYATVAMVHSVPELVVSHEEAQRLGKADEQRLLATKKLVLLVDLDQTIIHTTNDAVPPNMRDVHCFRLYGPRSQLYHTRLRPGTRQFLENISQIYELHICTFGSRMYAHTIADMIDPEQRFFSHRILSRDECYSGVSKTANLKALFPCGDSLVCIIDDREDVWNYSPNVVRVKPYHFFQHTGDINAPPGLTKTEEDGAAGESVLTKAIEQASQQSSTPEHLQSSCKKAAELKKGKKQEGKKEKDTVDKNSEHKDLHDEEIKLCENTEEGTSSGEFLKPSANQESCIKEMAADSINTKDEKLQDEEIKISTKTGNVENKTCVKPSVTSEKSKTSGSRKQRTSKLPDERRYIIEDDFPLLNSPVYSSDNSSGDSIQDESEERPHSPRFSEELSFKDVLISECGSQNEIDTLKTSKDETNNDNDKLGIDDTENKCIQNPEEKVVPDQSDNGKRERTISINSSQSDMEEIVNLYDDDDYLIYLEDILRRIHKAYYQIYKQMEENNNPGIPDMKYVVPYVRRKVLQGVNILFSGVIPMNMKLEKHRACVFAKSLGAIVQTMFVPRTKYTDDGAHYTTHVIATRLGTVKVNEARRSKGVYIVTLDWLWCCAERWERVDERLFRLTKETSCASPHRSRSVHAAAAHPVNVQNNTTLQPSLEQELYPTYDPLTGKRVRIQSQQKQKLSFQQEQLGNLGTGFSEDSPKPDEESLAINPLSSFSSQDLAEMEHEVDDDSSDDNEEDCEESLRRHVLGQEKRKHSDNESSSADSLSGDYPHGWSNQKKKLFKKQSKVSDSQESSFPMYPRGEFPTDSDKSVHENSSDSSVNSSIGSVDEEMAAAVERDFLGL